MKRVLFVDDSEETRELVHMIFESVQSDDLVIDYADNSQQAIVLFNKNDYNACILDVSLPDLTGYYLGKLIRTACPNMPIAFLTNYEGNLTKENAEYIQAEFWAKSSVFESPLSLRGMVMSIIDEDGCPNHEPIEMPSIIKDIYE